MNNADWDALIPDLKRWNGGDGIDPEGWIACEGNFQLASAYSLIFWPTFTEHRGMVFRGEVEPEHIESWLKRCGDKRSVEATVNHLHLADLHHPQCADVSVERLIYLGNVLQEIYTVKLAAQFPDRKFVVEFYEPPDKELREYQLLFYQQHDS
jgi:hypothetical protein